MIGGPRFYERAEIKDAVAYLSVLDNPVDAVSLLRIANRPRRGIGDTSLQRLVTHAELLGVPLFEAMADPEAAGLGTAAIKAVRGFHTLLQSLQSSAQELEARRARRGRARRGVARSRRSRRSGRSRPAAGSRTWRSSSASPANSGPSARNRRCRRSCRRSRSSRSGWAGGGGVARDADDDPQRKGTRVPRRVPDRHGGGHLPALALDRGQRDRGGAEARVRRYDAGDGEADVDARDGPLALRPPRVQPAVPLPGRAPARASSGSGCARPRGRAMAPSGRRPRHRGGARSRFPRYRPATPSATAPWAKAW